MNLDGFSMHALAIELQKNLVGGRIEKVTQQSKYFFTFHIHKLRQNFLLKFSSSPRNPSLHLIKNTPENLPEPSTFCMVLRKKIEDGRISAIRQHELDRIIFVDVDSIGIDGKIQTFTLVAELIGKYSNLILILNNIIIDALKRVGVNSSRVRTVLPNHLYQLPPAQNRLNVFSCAVEDILERIKSFEDSTLEKAIMNSCQGFGLQTINETIFRAGLFNDQKISKLDVKHFEKLKKAFIEIFEASTKPSPCFVNKDGKIIIPSSIKLNYISEGQLENFPTMSEMLERVDKIVDNYVPPDKDRFSKFVNNELRRAKNKLSILEKELATADNADEWRIRADNLLTYRHQLINHKNDVVTVSNIYSETGEKILIPIERRLTIAANIQLFYKKYDKLKRSIKYLSIQIKDCCEEIAYLESIALAISVSTTLAEIEEIQNELIAGGYIKKNRKKAALSQKAQPFRFIAPDGAEILVGKNNLQNDYLTFKVASPEDLWLHTKDITGSHVIIRSKKVSDETLQLAAEIAVYFSKARESSKVPVDYIQCKFVKKPAGAHLGFVVFVGQHTIYVTPRDNLKEFLKNCEKDFERSTITSS